MGQKFTKGQILMQTKSVKWAKLDREEQRWNKGKYGRIIPKRNKNNNEIFLFLLVFMVSQTMHFPRTELNKF